MILAAIETRITIRNPQIVLEKGIPDGARFIPYALKMIVGILITIVITDKIFNNIIQVIGYNRCKRIHHTLQDTACINFAILNRLCILNDNIFKKFLYLQDYFLMLSSLISFSSTASFDLSEVVKYTRDFFQFQKLDQFLISRRKMKFFLNLFTFLVNNTQITQIHAGITIQYLKNKTCLHISKEITHTSLHKSGKNLCIFQTYRKNHLICDYNTQRNRTIPVLVISFLDHRNINQDQSVIILHLNT